MPQQPPIHERDFLRQTANHRDLQRKLQTLGIQAPELQRHVQYVGIAWFRLAQQHLREAKAAQVTRSRRAALSRAYYAAYNASKSVRYIAQGSVSLKGDDHGKASSELPGDFPDSPKWAERITMLYENRLRADYDNWSTTRLEFSLTPAKAISYAEEFVRLARIYLRTQHGLKA